MWTLISYILVFTIGFLSGIAVYRNNEKRLDPLADKIDAKIKDRMDKK